MKKLGSNHDKETPQEELKRLRKENKKLGCPVRCSEKQRLISPVELLI